jgi:hypothetical protein
LILEFAEGLWNFSSATGVFSMQFSSADPFSTGLWSGFIAASLFLAACVYHVFSRRCPSPEATHPAAPFLRGTFPARVGHQRNEIQRTIMSSEYSPGGSRRSSRRGGGGGRRSDRGNRPSRSTHTEAPAKKETSILSKIIGFLTGKKSEPERPVRVEREPRARTSEPRSSESRSGERASRGRPTGMRSPEVIEVTSPRLYVGNLSFDASESDLFELFNGVGSVQNVEVVVNRHTMRSKGFAFVQMQSIEEAKRAVSELHDKEFLGRKLVVSGAKALEERRSERSREEAEPAASTAE